MEITQAHRIFRLETKVIIVLTTIINFFIIGTFAAFPSEGPLIELKDAGTALLHSFGEYSKYIWAFGLLSSGQSATMAGALTGQYMLEGFLQVRISRKKRVIIARLLTLFPCLIIARYAQVEMVYIILNVIQFVQLPFVLIPVFAFVENRQIMNGFEISPKRIWCLKIISVFFVVMNIYQVIEFLPVDLRYVVISLFGLAFYILLLLRLYRIRVKVLPKVSSVTELETMPSLEC